MDSFQKPALMVDFPDEDFDPEEEPTTGEEYLQRVIFERKKCPAVVVKDTCNRTDAGLSGSGFIELNDVKSIAPNTLIPTREWQSLQNHKFSDLRKQICEYRHGTKYFEHLEKSQKLINFEEKDEVFDFCTNNLPYVKTLLGISQRNLEILIEFLLEWLQEEFDKEEKVKKSWLTQWIYGTLSCLISPLEPYIHSVLREIAKTCINFRNELKSEDEDKVSPLNLLICIISKNFNQLDLGDNLL